MSARILLPSQCRAAPIALLNLVAVHNDKHNSADRLRRPFMEVQMTIAHHRITAISTSPRRLLAQLRILPDLEAPTDEVQSEKCVDPGPAGFDFSEEKTKRVFRGKSSP